MGIPAKTGPGIPGILKLGPGPGDIPTARPVPGIYIYILLFFLNILYIIYKLFVCKNYVYLLSFYIYRSKKIVNRGSYRVKTGSEC